MSPGKPDLFLPAGPACRTRTGGDKFPRVGQTISTAPTALCPSQHQEVDFPRHWQRQSKQGCFSALRNRSRQSFWRMALVRLAYLPKWTQRLSASVLEQRTCFDLSAAND